MISVIVPIYNVELYLPTCLESILSQTYQDLEIILVDDGSPDNSGRICDEYAKKDSRISVIHQKNAGQSGARNTGLDMARGEYVTFVDADDYIESDAYEILMTEVARTNVDILLFGHNLIKDCNERDTKSKKHEIKSTILGSDELWYEVFGNLNNAVWNKLYKRELIGRKRFKLGLFHGEDLLFNLEYINECSSALLISLPLYNYVKREGSVTTSNFSKKKLDEIVSKDFARELILKYCPKMLSIAEIFCFRARMNVIRSIYRSGKEHENVELLKQLNSYIDCHYLGISKYLKLKEKIEYFLYKNIKVVYKHLLVN